jgi:general secretion pathway protein I
LKNQRGFTLLEVIVASVIVAIAVAGVLSALSSSMRNAARLTDYDRSAMLARRKMDELLVERKLPKFVQLEGRWDPALTNNRESGWLARIQPWEMPPNAGLNAPVLDRIELEVWWIEGGKRRTFTLEGFRRGQLSATDLVAKAGASQ